MAAHGMLHSTKSTMHPSFLCRNKSNRIYSSNPFLPIFNQIKKIPSSPVSASINSSSHSHIISPSLGEVLKVDSDFHANKDLFFSEKIDSWMHKSVSHIVRNLKQAPLLVQIYSETDGLTEEEGVNIKTEKATSWPCLKFGWESEGSKSPDVLIFVEELGNEGDLNKDFEEGVNRIWGVVVQGKGMDSVPRCYLLKTNSICAGFGLGFCTHFCLMKVINFRDSALEQFKNCWLAE